MFRGFWVGRWSFGRAWAGGSGSNLLKGEVIVSALFLAEGNRPTPCFEKSVFVGMFIELLRERRYTQIKIRNSARSGAGGVRRAVFEQTPNCNLCSLVLFERTKIQIFE